LKDQGDPGLVTDHTDVPHPLCTLERKDMKRERRGAERAQSGNSTNSSFVILTCAVLSHVYGQVLHHSGFGHCFSGKKKRNKKKLHK